MRLIKAFAKNSVFANLAMVTFLMAGLLAATVMVREDIPGMDLDFITVSVAYPGADPEEVEEGVVRKIEEAVEGLEGIDEYTSTASEGMAATRITVIDGYDADRLLDRVRNEVDGITSFPEDAEAPSVIRPAIEKAVMGLGLLSDMDEARLKEWADTVQKELMALPGVNQVKISGTRAYEISVEISQETLRKYDLTIQGVADVIKANSLNRSGGILRTSGQDIRLRTLGRKYTGRELGKIKILSGSDGNTLYLRDIAHIQDRFTQDDLSVRADGRPAVLLNVMAGDEDTIDVADGVRRYLEDKNAVLPQGSRIMVLSDNTEMIRSNLSILYSNAALGLVMVFVLLWLFMDTQVSFWAGMGIPISLMGGLAVVHLAGISLNKVTLFGLIMVLGIVADDAIVVGEAVFYHRKKGESPLDAVVKGVSEVGLPVLAAILTTLAAFFPLYHIDGVLGKFIIAMPTAVIACLLVSLTECMVILPAHLAGLGDSPSAPKGQKGIRARVRRFHDRSVGSMAYAAQRIYLPLLKVCVRYRYLFVSVCIMVLLLSAGLVAGGFIKFTVFPRHASNIVVAGVEFPQGTPFAVTRAAVEQIEAAAQSAAAGFTPPGSPPLISNSLATVGQSASEKEGRANQTSPNIGGVRISLTDPGQSGIHSEAFISAWESAIGNIAGVQSLSITASGGGPPGASVEVCLQGEHLAQMAEAGQRVMARLNAVEGVSQVRWDNVPGKKELKFTLRPEAVHLGLSLSHVAAQIHNAYDGAQALKIQRGNDEVEVHVRLSRAERATRDAIGALLIRVKEDTWVPLESIAHIAFEPGYATITRKDGMRRITVSAKVDSTKVVAKEVIADLERAVFSGIRRDYPDMKIILEGDTKRSKETFGSLYLWIPVSLMGMYVIIATMFRSYVQPFLILTAIPFGLVGAVLGHFIMGHILSMLSIYGMVALAGVVVNDAIVLIERVNMNLAEGMEFFDALFQGGVRRFRAVMLTSLSTVGGLLPLISESSQYARQLIPMGISLAFGVAFATLLTLVLLPCLLTITNDIRYVLAGGLGQNRVYRNRIEPAFARNTIETEPHPQGDIHEPV